MFTRIQSDRIIASVVIAIALITAAGVSTGVRGDEEERALNADPHRTGPVTPAEDLDGLRRHFRARNTSTLTDGEVQRIYLNLKAELAKRYAAAEQRPVAGYQKWARYNRVPYISATHGNRYVNNYANHIAGSYGRFENAGTMPVGSVLAKDTFTIDKNGTVRPGPLMVMEKMQPGFNYVSGDWSYLAVMPDGSILGKTSGDAAEAVEFCVSCHLAVEGQDHMYFIPEMYRKK